jgi:hydroxyethylthiazole kinase-like uncharacterized protein yjeF
VFSAYSVASIRAAEAEAIAAVGDDTLMRRAATGLASVVLRELKPVYAKAVLLLVGPGNNGGDGLYAAVKLRQRGVVVFAWRAADRVHAAGWEAFCRAGGREVDFDAAVALVPQVDLIVDALLGIGGKPGLREPVTDLVDEIDAADTPVISVDLPSGLDADSGALSPSFLLPSHTVTFGGRKLCHVLEPAKTMCDQITVIDIGLPEMEPALHCWELADVAVAWPVPLVTADKYSRGVVGLHVGSATYPGAAVLAASGAIKAGAGMVRFLGDPEVGQRVLASYPNVVLGEGRVQAYVLGCGWGDQPYGAGIIAKALDEAPAVIDADALRYLTPEPHAYPALLTPHAGELARLLEVDRADVEADPITHAKAAAQRYHAVVLLKGTNQIVTDGRDVFVPVPGPSWAATAGSGDVLAGSCGSLLAAGRPPIIAACAAASIQALAYRHANSPVPPQDLEFPWALLNL